MSNPADSALRVLIVDSDPIVRDGAALLLQNKVNWLIEVASYTEIAALTYRTPKPHVALIGVHRLDFVEVRSIHLLKAIDIRLLAFGSAMGITHLRKLVALGVDGYVCRSQEAFAVISAILACANGKHPIITGQETQQLVKELKLTNGSTTSRPNLTPKEQAILQAVVNGMTNREIAQRFRISLGTVKVHISHLLRKYGLSSRTQLAIHATRHSSAPITGSTDLD